jgi:hypothetical protein
VIYTKNERNTLGLICDFLGVGSSLFWFSSLKRFAREIHITYEAAKEVGHVA